MTQRLIRRSLIGAAMALLAVTSASAQADPAKRKPDLADAVAGTYHGDVISDSKGSSKSNVTVTVTRVGKNLVEVTSSYKRLPMIQVPLERAMDKILASGSGDSTFLYDPAKSPAGLDVSFHQEVSWSGFKR